MTEPIDLRSDTVTKPVPGMRRAMADAEVGDDVLDGDPTTRRLEERVAAMLGTERALFFPTGTMANQAGLWALSQPGTEVLAHEDSHIVNWEMAGAAALAGVQPRLIRGAPRITLETLAAAQRAPSRDAPRTSLLCL
ncbi:MAG: PLP-dependent transferase, partial [Gemmatimonadetes bacterium]|nr:PLP-dependent transferase [Gemmatimonadota bacterium]